jgi:hypothetical protein
MYLGPVGPGCPRCGEGPHEGACRTPYERIVGRWGLFLRKKIGSAETDKLFAEISAAILEVQRPP